MRLYIVRHGKAEEQSGSGRDEDRRLTNKGWRQARFLGKEIARAAKSPERILTSGLIRAAETASAIQKELECECQVERCLETGHGVSEVVAMLEGLRSVSSVLVVGHNPQLSELVSVLVKGVAADQCALRTGEAVVIDIRLNQPVGTGKLVEKLRLSEAEAGVGGVK